MIKDPYYNNSCPLRPEVRVDEGLDPQSKSSEKTDESARGGAESGALDPELSVVVGAWGKLTDRSKAVIIDMARRAIAKAANTIPIDKRD